jgi:hypothetical protein
MHFCAGLPIILVGCKKDLRRDPRAIEELRKTSQRPVTSEEVSLIPSHFLCSCLLPFSFSYIVSLPITYIMYELIVLHDHCHRSSHIIHCLSAFPSVVAMLFLPFTMYPMTYRMLQPPIYIFSCFLLSRVGLPIVQAPHSPAFRLFYVSLFSLTPPAYYY